MSVYQVEKLMEETRRVAAEFRKATGQTLPVGPELARYDANRLLNLESPPDGLSGVDAVSGDDLRYQIKNRVVFDDSKGGHRIGQLNFHGDWNVLLLVLLDEQYNTVEIYQMDRETAVEAVDELNNDTRKKRGPMSVAKFKALGSLVWDIDQGLLNAT
ncbi:MAG: hypothetical protein P1U80_11255 [Pseudomonadales bacterium]|nr:hypothetical protein [Pseudomonadales bacterium]